MQNNFKQPPTHHKHELVNPHDVTPGCIYRADLEMHNGEIKNRPVLVICYDGENQTQKDKCAVLPITSKYDKKPRGIQDNYAFLKNWQECGLARESWVDCNPYKFETLSIEQLDNSHRYKPISNDVTKNMANKVITSTRLAEAQKTKQFARDVGFHI